MNTLNTGLAEERLRSISSHLQITGAASVEDLCTELGVSPATIRRDLAELDNRGLVRRVHGGAVSIQNRLNEPVFEDKAREAASEKLDIAEAALKFINPNDSIYLDGGSTVLALARLLIDMTKLTVLTNSLRVASLYADSGPRTILVGGELRRISQTFVGSMTRPLIEQVYVEKAFMGTIGLKNGVMTTTDPAEAFTKEFVMSHAENVYLLAYSEKLNKSSFVRFGELEKGQVFVTDSGIEKRAAADFSKRGVEVVYKK